MPALGGCRPPGGGCAGPGRGEAARSSLCWLWKGVEIITMICIKTIELSDLPVLIFQLQNCACLTNIYNIYKYMHHSTLAIQ